MLQPHIKELIELGNGIGGIKVSASTREEIEALLKKSIERSKKRKNDSK
jgi:hypothetical protein